MTLEKAVKVCRAYEQSTKQVKEFREDNSNPSNSATKVNKVTQKPGPRVLRSNKPEGGNRHMKKNNEGMKINCNFCGYEHEKNREKCPAWGKTCDKTCARVEIILSPNARKYMQCRSPKMVMMMTMTNGSWL